MGRGKHLGGTARHGARIPRRTGRPGQSAAGRQSRQRAGQGAAVAPARAPADRPRGARSRAARPRPEPAGLAGDARRRVRRVPRWRRLSTDRHADPRTAAVRRNPRLPADSLWRRNLCRRAYQSAGRSPAGADRLPGTHEPSAGAGRGKPDRHLRPRRQRPAGGKPAARTRLHPRAFPAVLGAVHPRRLGRQPLQRPAVAALRAHRAAVRRRHPGNLRRQPGNPHLPGILRRAGPARAGARLGRPLRHHFRGEGAGQPAGR
ncbi:hypothetical protein D9M71_151730 [compost metagenome]